MKILIVSQYYYPEQFQINEIAPELVRRGHSVTVLCGLPNYPQGKIFPGYNDISKRDEYVDGVRIIRCWQIPRGSNNIKLSLNYLSFWFEANKMIASLDNDFDIVFSYQLSPVTSALPALKYKQRFGTPAIIYCLDLWPESIKTDIAEGNPIYKVIHHLSRKIYNGFDRVLVTSPSFKNYLSDLNGVQKNKIYYQPQHASSEMLSMDLESKKGGDIHFMFAGNLGKSQDLDIIIKAATFLGNDYNYKIDFVGDGSRRKDMEKLVKDNHLDDYIIFHGQQSRLDMPKFYSKADALLLTLHGDSVVGGTIPAKLQTYMTTGKPIIGAINGDSASIIRAARCGECVSAGDYKGLANLMRDVIESPSKYIQCGINARDYFSDNFTLKIIVDNLEQHFREVNYRFVY